MGPETMDQKPGKAIEPVMLANLARAVDFVKFGEAKNAALLTFASAWILAAATLAMNPTARTLPQILWGLIFGVPWFIIAAGLAMVSFLPQIDPDRITGDKPGGSPNLLFFGHLAEGEPKETFARLVGRYVGKASGELTDAYFTDLGCQIALNSRVAHRKYKLFLLGLDALVIGLGVCALNAALLVADLWAHHRL